MKLTHDSSVNRVLSEGITNLESLLDFDKKSIQLLPSVCKESVPEIVPPTPNPESIQAEAAVPGANVSTIAVRRLIVAMQAAKYYTSIGRTLNTASMHYTNVLSDFKIEWDDYESLREQDEPTVPLINDRDNDRKVIKWVPIFMDCASRTFGSKGPLAYVLHENETVLAEVDDPLQPQSYFGSSGSLQDELIARLPHTGAIFKNDNATVFMMIEKASRGTSVESTVKAFSRRKDGRGAFNALVANHAGEVKYRAILKKRMNLLQSTKWNGRAYALEAHVSQHRAAVDDLRECSNHITVSVPNDAQRVEYLIDSITCADNTLQAAIGLVQANTNNMRNDFELAATALIEVDPYRSGAKSSGSGREATVSGIDFSAGRGPKTGVDLRWYSKEQFKKLSEDEKSELKEYMNTKEGKKAMRKSRNSFNKRKQDDVKDDNATKSNKTSWHKKMKKALQTPNGIKKVFSIMAEEEKTNHGFVAALASSIPPPPAPAPAPVPPPPAQTPTVTFQAQTSALSKAFPSTSTRLQMIQKSKNGNDSD